MTNTAAGLAIVALGVLTSCAGGKVLIMARDIDYPVSATSAVFDPGGEVVTADDARMSIVGRFSIRWRQWTLFWTMLSLTQQARDLSAELRHEIESRSGDGIVNLTVRGSDDPFWIITSLVPILPSHLTVEVKGDVFRLSPPE